MTVKSIADKMLSVVSQPVPFKGNKLTVGASFGIALYPDDGDVAKTLIREADEAMYMSKSLEKNRYTFAVEEENVSL
ncbi:MAG: GGDEF domain-containing protein [Moritella dasanensis]|jgi:GGDEF domain-containing protein